MDAVSHNADVDQMRIGGHKGILASVSAIFIQYSGTDISTRLRIKLRFEMVFFVVDHISQLRSRLALLQFGGCTSTVSAVLVQQKAFSRQRLRDWRRLAPWRLRSVDQCALSNLLRAS